MVCHLERIFLDPQQKRKGVVKDKGLEKRAILHFPHPGAIAALCLVALTLAVLEVSPTKAMEMTLLDDDPAGSRFEASQDPPFTESSVIRQQARERARAALETRAGRRHFVGNEPLTIQYMLLFPFGARLNKENLQPNLAPFEVMALRTGPRTSLISEKNLEAIPITLTLRLPEKYPDGLYDLPSFTVSLNFEHFATAEESREELTVTSESLQLAKVPLYVDVVQRHDGGTLGEVLPVVIEIHAGAGREILNEYPPETPQKGIVYLSEYSPPSPLVLVKRQRREFTAKSYRIIKWTYDLAMHGLEEKGVKVTLPPIIWLAANQAIKNGDKSKSQTISSKDGMGEVVNTAKGTLRIIQPAPITIKGHGITSADSPLKPMKGLAEIPESEEFLLLELPMALFRAGLVLGVLWLIITVLHFLKPAKRQPIALEPRDRFQPPTPVYDRWPWQRWKLDQQLEEARSAFQKEPSRASCATLRNILVRRIVAQRLQKKRRIAIQEAYALTATDLAALAGETPQVVELRALEKQLAENQYGSGAFTKERC